MVKEKLFVCLHNFELCVFPISFEDEIYLLSLTLELLCCALCRCQVRVVVSEIVAGPHALDSCECMNIEGQILRKT